MTKISHSHSPGRRQFFRTSAQAAGALSALALLPASIQRALAIPAAVESGTIKDIKHIVILMQENRSFDHYFGTMRGVRGFGDRFPIPLPNGKSVFFQPNPEGGQEILPFHRDSRTGNALIGSGTPHNFPDQQAAWNQGKMDTWIQYKNQATMGFFMREDIPFQFALADAFTICDGYHCSILTGTDPNRIVFWSGTNANPELRKQGINCTDADSEPVNSRCWPKPYNWVEGRAQQPDGSGQIDPSTGEYNYKYTNSTFKWDTLPDLLERAGVSWHIYQNMNNNWTGAMHGCLAFESFRTAQPGSPIYEHGLTGGPNKEDGAVNFLAQFRKDVMNGSLPEVSWVLPTQDLAEHPGSKEGVAGAADFISEVLDALTSNPEVWSKTAVFVTFDENDGFFDHLPMPAVPSYDANGILMGKSTVSLEGEYFDDPEGKYLVDTTTGKIRPWGLSSRVPMYVLSPWSKGGWVNSEVFDHTSVGRFLEQRFGITVDAISPWHRAVCGDLTSCFDFVSPNDPVAPKLPDTSNYPAINAAQRLLPTTTVTQAPATPQPLYQETGTRPSRALPYELHTSARVGQDGAVELLFSNTGAAGAVFHVYDQRNLDMIPRRYTIEAGKTLSDTWNGGDYELWVYSTNGFVRTFSGNTKQGAALEIQVCYEPAGNNVYVKVTNSGTSAVQAALLANAYREDGPWALTIEPGAVAEHHWSVEDSGNWYDFSVTAEGFERRFAGRMENGNHTVSDPAMAQHLG